jgi:hypothetical protein
MPTASHHPLLVRWDLFIAPCIMVGMNWPRARFSLRTLFVAVTLCAIFLGWQMRWIKQRREYLKEHPGAYREPDTTDKPATAPMLLWLWGEPAQTRLSVELPGSKDRKLFNPGPEAEEIRKLFPEAIIQVMMEENCLRYTWNPGTEWDWGKPWQAVTHSWKVPGRILYTEVVGSRDGLVWGSDEYTSDSAVAAAAVHAGVLRDGERGRIKISYVEGRDAYNGTTRNGKTSQSWGPHSSSFRIERAIAWREGIGKLPSPLPPPTILPVQSKDRAIH